MNILEKTNTIISKVTNYLKDLSSDLSLIKKRRRTSSYLRELLEVEKINSNQYGKLNKKFNQHRVEKYKKLKEEILLCQEEWKNSPINGEILIDLPKRVKTRILYIYNKNISENLNTEQKLNYIVNTKPEIIIEKLTTSSELLFVKHIELTITKPLLNNKQIVLNLISDGLLLNQGIFDVYCRIKEKNLKISGELETSIYKYLGLADKRLSFIKDNFELLCNRYDLNIKDPNIRKDNLNAIKELCEIYEKAQKLYKKTFKAYQEKDWVTVIKPIKDLIINITINKTVDFQQKNAMALECLQVHADSSLFLVLLYQYLEKPTHTEKFILKLLENKINTYNEVILAYNKPIIDQKCDLFIKEYVQKHIDSSTTQHNNSINITNIDNINNSQRQQTEELRANLLTTSEVQEIPPVV